MACRQVGAKPLSMFVFKKLKICLACECGGWKGCAKVTHLRALQGPAFGVKISCRYCKKFEEVWDRVCFPQTLLVNFHAPMNIARRLNFSRCYHFAFNLSSGVYSTLSKSTFVNTKSDVNHRAPQQFCTRFPLCRILRWSFSDDRFSLYSMFIVLVLGQCNSCLIFQMTQKLAWLENVEGQMFY